MSRRSIAHCTRAALALLLALPHAAHAQRVGAGSVFALTGESEERLRLDQLLGRSSTAGFEIRTPSRFTTLPGDSARWSIGLLLPRVRAIRNSGLPYSLNQDDLWASRGWNGAITAGAYFHYGPVRALIAPTAVSEQNLDFQVIPYPQQFANPPRSAWANPFHPLPESIDLPLRFGNRSRRQVFPGQSSVTVDAANVAFGGGTENLWWGPGVRNAIALSDNAPGFPHLFAQTRRPWRTRAGTFDAQWIVGQLTESAFFDTNSTNNKRSLSGIVAAWSPPGDSGLTLGVTRLVMAARSGASFPVGAAFDVLRTVGHPFTDSTTRSSGRDQLFTAFGRWVFVPAGFEAYVEWARFEEPLSLQDFLEYPGHSEGYTLGFQWAHPLATDRHFQLQGEASYLEPDPSLRLRPVATTYTSRSVPQGFTERGQTLGAAIGPGASSQWLAGDVFARRWRAGVYLSRIRWDNGVLFEPIVPKFRRQDVTLSAGARGSFTWHGERLSVDFAHAARYNYLFQAFVLKPGLAGGIDLLNNSLSVTLSTPVGIR